MSTEAEIRADERRKCWEEVNALIQPGPLSGNGCDQVAQRNGLILAANHLCRDVPANMAADESQSAGSLPPSRALRLSEIRFEELEAAITSEVLESFALSDAQVLSELEAPLIALRVWHRLHASHSDQAARVEKL